MPEQHNQHTQTVSSPAEPNQAGPSPTKPTIQPGWISLEEVEHMFMEAGLARTRNLLGRYCRNGRLIGAKDAGPSGDQWYVDPASIPLAIAELKRIEGKGKGPTESGRAHPGPAEPTSAQPRTTDTTAASLEENRNTTASTQEVDQAQPGPAEPGRAHPGPAQADLDIYTHPYVQRLERDLDETKAQLKDARTDLKDQVKVTQELQRESNLKLIELQQMVQAGQSKWLSKLFFKPKQIGNVEPEIDNDDAEDEDRDTRR